KPKNSKRIAKRKTPSTVISMPRACSDAAGAAAVDDAGKTHCVAQGQQQEPYRQCQVKDRIADPERWARLPRIQHQQGDVPAEPHHVKAEEQADRIDDATDGSAPAVR